MITKEQAMQLKVGDYVYQIGSTYNFDKQQKLVMLLDGTSYYTIPKVNRWKVTSLCKTWKRDQTRFRVGLKYGLYDYCDLTQENNHIFSLVMPE